MAVQEFMRDDVVRVDSAIAVIRGITYPIKAISSVSVVQDHMQQERMKAAGMVIFGVIFMLVGKEAPAGILFGILLLIAGVIYYRKIKDNFVLMLVSHSGERRALESTNKDYILSVRDNIVRAISASV